METPKYLNIIHHVLSTRVSLNHCSSWLIFGTSQILKRILSPSSTLLHILLDIRFSCSYFFSTAKINEAGLNVPAIICDTWSSLPCCSASRRQWLRPGQALRRSPAYSNQQVDYASSGEGLSSSPPHPYLDRVPSGKA